MPYPNIADVVEKRNNANMTRKFGWPSRADSADVVENLFDVIREVREVELVLVATLGFLFRSSVQ